MLGNEEETTMCLEVHGPEVRELPCRYELVRAVTDQDEEVLVWVCSRCRCFARRYPKNTQFRRKMDTRTA